MSAEKTRPAPRTPELWPWVSARIREYARREQIAVGAVPRDPFLADQTQRYGINRVTRNDVFDWREILAKLDAEYEGPIDVDVSELDFDDDRTEPFAESIGKQSDPLTSNPTVRSCEPEPRRAELRELLEAQRARAEVAELKRQRKELLEELAHADVRAGIVDALRGAREPQPITRRETASGMREATAVVCVSDLHLEEVIEPAKVEWRNAFNPTIAPMRMGRLTEGFLWLLGLNRSRFAIRDAVVWLGGDVISNWIHEELEETNAMTPPQATAFAFELLADLIRTVLDRSELERIEVVCNVGNHGRSTQYTRTKTRVENSYEWLVYWQLARVFADEPRLHFTIAAGSHVYLGVYDQTIRFTHGDDVKYGGGIGGISIPIRKAVAAWQSFRHADYTVMGHFHQLTHGRDFIVNGSLVGYGEYSLSIKAEYEPPQQAFFLLDSKHGRTCAAPIWCEDEREGWRQ